jgi:hypothetical protein
VRDVELSVQSHSCHGAKTVRDVELSVQSAAEALVPQRWMAGGFWFVIWEVLHNNATALHMLHMHS